MKIALIGYGKMGRAIETLGINQGNTFPVIIDEHNSALLNSASLGDIDVAIEFSTPDAAPDNIRKCINMGIPVVTGTTGWNHLLPEAEAYCREKEGTLFYASNYSIGVNILFALNRKLAEIMNRFPEYAVSISEVHHVHKKDAPSGTAITLAEQIIEVNRQISSWMLMGSGDHKETVTGHLPIEAIREGEVKGRHTICYESDMDSITLGHEAKTRDVFAVGALLAAGFIKDKKGIFGMQDLLKL
jgi:4-hydroxy-tetrahydrodipicolinate reductase